MMARQTGSEAQLSAFYNMGRSDANKYSEPHWIGAIGSNEEKEYLKGFNERKQEKTR